VEKEPFFLFGDRDKLKLTSGKWGTTESSKKRRRREKKGGWGKDTLAAWGVTDPK